MTLLPGEGKCKMPFRGPLSIFSWSLSVKLCQQTWHVHHQQVASPMQLLLTLLLIAKQRDIPLSLHQTLTEDPALEGTDIFL